MEELLYFVKILSGSLLLAYILYCGFFIVKGFIKGVEENNKKLSASMKIVISKSGNSLLFNGKRLHLIPFEGEKNFNNAVQKAIEKTTYFSTNGGTSLLKQTSEHNLFDKKADIIYFFAFFNKDYLIAIFNRANYRGYVAINGKEYY